MTEKRHLTISEAVQRADEIMKEMELRQTVSRLKEANTMKLLTTSDDTNDYDLVFDETVFNSVEMQEYKRRFIEFWENGSIGLKVRLHKIFEL